MRLVVNMTTRKRRQFTAEFKADAVKLVRTGCESIAQVARNLDLTETSLREWVRRAEIEAGEGPPGALSRAERNVSTTLRHDLLKNSELLTAQWPIPSAILVG